MRAFALPESDENFARQIRKNQTATLNSLARKFWKAVAGMRVFAAALTGIAKFLDLI